MVEVYFKRTNGDDLPMMNVNIFSLLYSLLGWSQPNNNNNNNNNANIYTG